MKNRHVVFIMSFVAFFLLLSATPVYAGDGTGIDTTLTYEKVDLVVEYEWGDPETIEKVTVLVHYKNSLVQLIVAETREAKLEYYPSEGMVYKIYRVEKDSRILIKKIPPLNFEIAS